MPQNWGGHPPPIRLLALLPIKHKANSTRGMGSNARTEAECPVKRYPLAPGGFDSGFGWLAQVGWRQGWLVVWLVDSVDP